MPKSGNLWRVSKLLFSVIALLSVSENLFAMQNTDSNNFNPKMFLEFKGDCKSENGAIDLSKIYFLRDSKLVQSTAEGFRSLELEGEDFSISYYSSSGKFKSKYFTSVALDIVSQNKNLPDMDIETSFMLIEGKVAIYWKETFRNRIYHQGIFQLEGEKLVTLCHGKGGTVTTR